MAKFRVEGVHSYPFMDSNDVDTVNQGNLTIQEQLDVLCSLPNFQNGLYPKSGSDGLISASTNMNLQQHLALTTRQDIGLPLSETDSSLCQ
jgi:hypothetical protein